MGYLAGANSIFVADRLLTTGNPGIGEDQALLGKLGLRTAFVAP
jgi:biotin synthase